MKHLLTVLFVLTAGTVHAAEGPDGATMIEQAGSVNTAEGLQAWGRIEQVVSHPRCANCHVGSDNVPMWSGPSFGEARPHGMNINAGTSRIGAETLLCSTCHMTSSAPNDTPHAPPHVALPWQLAPVEFVWFGKSGAEICAQLKDPERNGGRDAAGIIDHLKEDASHLGFVQWGWEPGGTREPVPGTMNQHFQDVAIWGAAGQPCP